MARFIRGVAVAAALSASAFSFGQALDVVLAEGLREPTGVAVDPQNNHYIVDSANDRLLRLNPETGVIAILAGTTDAEAFVDERGQRARFRNPQSMVALPLDNTGVRLKNGTVVNTGFLVTDAGNHALRHVGLDGSVSTLLGDGQPGAVGERRLNSPVGLAIGADGFVYIADAQNNAIRRYHLLTGDFQNVVSEGLLQPQGVAFDDAGNLYIADTGNHAIKVKRPGQDLELLAGGNAPSSAGFINAPFVIDSRFDRPAGLLWAGGRTGLLVADSGNAAVRRIYDLNTSSPRIETFGANAAAGASLRSPVALAKELGGAILVADPGQNTLFAIRTTQTPQPPVPAPTIGYVIFTNLFECPGTFLVPVTNATFNNDVVIAIRGDAQSQTFFISGPTDEVVDVPPNQTPLPYADCEGTMPESLISPAPDVTIKTFSSQADRKPSATVVARFRFKAGNPLLQGSNPSALTLATATRDAQVYYTFGPASNPPADPTPASGILYQPGTPVNLNLRTEPVIVKARAFKGNYSPSDVVEKQFDPATVEYSSVGFQREFVGGPGSTIILPVNLSPANGVQVRSYQFRAEVRAAAGAAPLPTFSLLPGNDFIPFVYASKANEAFTYSGESTEGIVVAALGSPDTVAITNASTIAVLALHVPATAQVGQQYNLMIQEVSATSDGNQLRLAMTNLPAVRFTVQHTGFLVGDTASATWYNAGDFGDGELKNNDVNAAFLASFGLRVPYTVSDAFKAMDVYPPDSELRRGGDNQIRFLDWQTVLLRSVGLDPNNWIRRWGASGQLEQSRTNLPQSTAFSSRSQLKALSVGADSGLAWDRPARLGGLRVVNAAPGSVVRVPVYVKPDEGVRVDGLQFIARVEAVGEAPSIDGNPQFVSANQFPASSSGNILPGGIELAGGVYAAWNLGAFSQPITTSNVLGHVTFTVPTGAAANARYNVSFAQVDGASGLSVQQATQLDFESVPTTVYVGVTPVDPEVGVADEWVSHFFSSTNASSALLADPDQDGLVNYIEFNAGTHPLSNDSGIQFSSAQQGAVTLRWYGARDVQYRLEKTADLKEPWAAVTETISGEGRFHEHTHTQPLEGNLFFRMRVNP